MNKKFKKICSIAMTLAVTASSAMSISVSAANWEASDFSGYTIIDDKGMLKNDAEEGYKTLYQDGELYLAEPLFSYSEFILSEDVDYEEVNERVIEIFEEFYPDNYLGVSPVPTEGMQPTNDTYPAYLEYVNNYSKNYKPNLTSKTVDGVTTYTLCANNKYVHSLNDEKVAAARKYSMAFMEKLNEEKLISAFYDFGEKYMVVPVDNEMFYSTEDINVINNYIKENNIDCTLDKYSNYYYKLNSADDDIATEFSIAADIYEATSITVKPINTKEPFSTYSYGKNSLEDLATNATTEPATAPATEAVTTASTTATEPITTTTTTTTDTNTNVTTNIIGDANRDNKLDIRDAAYIARLCAKSSMKQYSIIPEWADYNNDGVVNIRDAAAIAKDLVNKKV